jgi:hypothetical protein
MHVPGRPHHGAAVAMAFSVPIDATAAGERGRTRLATPSLSTQVLRF